MCAGRCSVLKGRTGEYSLQPRAQRSGTSSWSSHLRTNGTSCGGRCSSSAATMRSISGCHSLIGDATQRTRNPSPPVGRDRGEHCRVPLEYSHGYPSSTLTGTPRALSRADGGGACRGPGHGTDSGAPRVGPQIGYSMVLVPTHQRSGDGGRAYLDGSQPVRAAVQSGQRSAWRTPSRAVHAPVDGTGAERLACARAHETD